MRNVVELPLIGINNTKIIYRCTDDVSAKLATITELYNMFEQNLTMVLDKETYLHESLYSATIEGAKTTIERVKSGRNKKDEKMVINVHRAIEGIVPFININEHNIVRVWKTIVKDVCENTNTQAGDYRDKMVYIANSNGSIMHTPMIPSLIPTCVSKLVEYINSNKDNSLIVSIVAQFYWEYVHPMCDGNGRLGRVLTMWVLDKSEYSHMYYAPISKKIYERMSGYYKSFIDSERLITIDGSSVIDITPFIIYMLNIYIESINEVKIRTRSTLKSAHIFLLTLMSQKGVGVELSVKKCSLITGLSDSECDRLLNELVDIGYVIKVNNVYKLVISI